MIFLPISSWQEDELNAFASRWPDKNSERWQVWLDLCPLPQGLSVLAPHQAQRPRQLDSPPRSPFNHTAWTKAHAMTEQDSLEDLHSGENHEVTPGKRILGRG